MAVHFEQHGWSVLKPAQRHCASPCPDVQAIEDGETDVVNHQFVAKAVKPLVDMLLPQLLKQEEGQDLDEATWNLDMAAGTCLGFLANVVGDDIVGHVMPFVQVR